MRWLLVGSKQSDCIRDAQKWLFEKYIGTIPDFFIRSDTNIQNWCKDVLEYLETVRERNIVFGLDDMLITGKLHNNLLLDALSILQSTEIERFELAYAHRSFNKGKFIYNELEEYLTYPPDALYLVSTQFSLWKVEALKRVLKEIDSDPWSFEVKGTAIAACFDYPVFNYIEESALSKRWNGINVRGMKQEDIDELIRLGFLNKNELINEPHRNIKSSGKEV